MIADQEPPLPHAGDLLSGIGIRGHGEPSHASTGAEHGITVVSEPDAPPQDVEYVLTGVVRGVRDVDAGTYDGQPFHSGAECVLDTGVGAFQVQFSGYARDVTVGSRLQVRCKLVAIGGYEWEAFGLVDTRRDWHVHDVVWPVSGDGGEADALINATPAS